MKEKRNDESSAILISKRNHLLFARLSAVDAHLHQAGDSCAATSGITASPVTLGEGQLWEDEDNEDRLGSGALTAGLGQ